MSDRVDLHDYFDTIGEDPLLFCPNPGNAGDSAIALATYQLLEESGREYTIVDWTSSVDSNGYTAVYGGGGNLGAPQYGEARQFIERHYSQAGRLVVLPHTIRGNEDVLRGLSETVDIFCREQTSYEWARTHVAGANVYLADDMAFRLDAREILDRHGPSGTALMRRIGRGVWGSAARRVGMENLDRSDFRVNGRLGTIAFYQLARSFASQNGTLHALRTDVEGTDQDRPVGNVDVSRVFEYGVAPRSRALQATAFILAYLDRFDRIVTNRLHIGILAGLLNKEVDFYPNNYFKNKAVYECSMRDRFPCVRWHGD